MNETLLLFSAALLLGLYVPIKKKLNREIKFFKKTITLDKLATAVLVVIVCLTFFINIILDNNLGSQKTLNDGRFPAAGTVFLLILRWLTQLSFGIMVLDNYYDIKKSRDFVSYIAFPVVIINICVFRFNIISIMGDGMLYNWRAIIFAVQLAAMALLSGRRLVDDILTHNFSDLPKRIGKAAMHGLIYLAAFVPTYFAIVCFGEVGPVADNFNAMHRVIIYTIIAVTLILYSVFRKKDREEQWYMLAMLSIAGFIAYYAYFSHRNILSGLPLHLCYTAITLMVVCFCFRVKSVFYFNYIVNVLGALVAILIPDANNITLFTDDHMVFWYCHSFDFILPIVASLLGVFSRPKLKDFFKAVGVFFIYIIIAAFMNGWLNNSPSLNPGGAHKVDYFFLYGNTLTDMFNWSTVMKASNVWMFTIGDTTVKIFWLYDLLVFVVFSIMMAVIWGFYAGLYRVEDAHRELARRRKLMKIDKLNMIKEMNGRPMGSPLFEEYTDMVVINNFSKRYTGADKKSVDNLNLEMHEGEVWGFIGHNGAGKSTTIKSLVGIQSITEGQIIVEGYDIAKQPLEAKLKIGYVSDNHAVYEKLTGRDYVYYVADLYLVDKAERDELYEKYVKMFNMENAMDNQIKSYSHGMKQKLMVISTLVHNPKVWVLDEPLTGLDPTSSYLIKKCMREHADKGNIVFFSSHIIEVVEKICDKIAIISDGILRETASMEDIKKSNRSLEDMYLHYIKGVEGVDGERAEIHSQNKG